jgi:hypothetical protein
MISIGMSMGGYEYGYEYHDPNNNPPILGINVHGPSRRKLKQEEKYAYMTWFASIHQIQD